MANKANSVTCAASYRHATTKDDSEALYASTPFPSGVRVLTTHEYTDASGRRMVNYRVVAPGSEEVQCRTTSQVFAVDGSYLWKWGALKEYPLYRSAAASAAGQDDSPIFVVSSEVTVDALDDIRCCTVYKGVEGIQRTDWGPLLNENVITLCDYTAEGFALAEQVKVAISAARAKAGTGLDKVIDSVHGAWVMDSTGTPYMGASILTILQTVQSSTGETASAFLSRILTGRSLNTDTTTYAQPVAADDTNSVAVPTGPKKSKGGIAEILTHIFENDGVKIYSVDVNSRYMLVCSGEHANKTFSPGTQAYREYVQSVLVALGTPCISSIQHAALDRAIRASALSLVYTDRKTYEYMGNSYCVCNSNLYVHYSDTEVAVFYSGGWRSPEIIPKSICPVQFRPETRERLALPMDANYAADKSFREYVDALFSAVPETVRPLIAGYLVMSAIGYKYIKPILSFVGDAGSGKTTAAALFKDAVEQLPSYGWEGYVDQSTPKAIAAYISGNVVSIFDNSLTMPKNISAFMAGIVTGKSYTQRTLFTTADKSTVELNSVLLYTSLTIPTHENDTADRMLVVRFRGRPKAPSKTRADGLIVAHTDTQNRLTPILRRMICDAAAGVLAKGLKGTELLPTYAEERMGLFLTALSIAAQTVGYTDEEVHKAYIETRGHIRPPTPTPEIMTELPTADSLPPVTGQSVGKISDSEQAIIDVVSQEYLKLSDSYTVTLSDMLRHIQQSVSEKSGQNPPTSGRALRELLKDARRSLATHGITFSVGSGWHTVKFERTLKLD